MNLNEKIAKWLGIKKIYYNEWDDDKSSPYFIPSGKPWRTHKIDAIPLPNFTESMDAILKWVVPKMKSAKFVVFQTDYNYIVTIWASYFTEYEAVHQSVPMAFCLALEQYIDSQEVSK